MYERSRDLYLELKDHIRVAKDLLYPDECIQRLKNAKTGNEMDMIMAEYRKKLRE